MEASREENSGSELSPISELKKFIEDEKEQQNQPKEAATKDQGELLETSTDSLESGSEINPLWVLDSITASVEKCNSLAYETIFEEEVDSEIVLDSHSDGKIETSSPGEEGVENISGATADVKTVPQKEGYKRLSQGSDGSFGFEPQYEEDFSGYVEGKEYFKNLPTFHRLLTSAEKEELDDVQIQKNELITLRLEEQISGLHEQSDYAQDMMDTHAMRSEYWDYPYPSQSEAFDKALRSGDKSQLLENMRMKIRGRLRQPGNSSSDSGCQDTDANHSSLDESDVTNRLHSNKGQCQEQAKSQIEKEQTNYTSDSGVDREESDVKIRTSLKTESSSLDQSSSNRRQILEGLQKLITSSKKTEYSLPQDNNHHPDTQINNIGLVSRTGNGPSIPARPMALGQLKFVHYENITIVKKRVDEDDSEVHPNTPNGNQGAKENCNTIKDEKVGNQESIVEPIDIDLSDPDVLEATKRMQLAFRKRRELHGSKKFRSMQRMRAESDSVSYRSLGICSSASLENHKPFQVDTPTENRGVQMIRHHSLPIDFANSQAHKNVRGDNIPDSLKTKEKAKERVCKKLSRQKSVSQYQPYATSLIEQQEQSLTDNRLSVQSVEENGKELEPFENGNPGIALSEEVFIKEVADNTRAPLGPSSPSEVVNPSMELSKETSEGEDLDKKLRCITGNDQQPMDTSEENLQESGPGTVLEPDIDLKDPKVQDASKMIQQVFRRKKLHSKRSKGSVEDKACKKVKANKANSLNHFASPPDTPITKEMQKVSDSDRTDCPPILFADTTVNVVISDDELDKNILSNEQQLKDPTGNISSTNSLEPIDVTLGNTPATVGYQTYKGVVIVNEKLSENLESNPKPTSPERENITHADANANFRSPLEKKHPMKRASSIKEANLGDDIDIDLLDAEVKEVTEKLKSLPSPTRFPTNEELQDMVLINETDLELKKLNNQNLPESNDANFPVDLTDAPLDTNKTNKSGTDVDVDIDLSDPDVRKTVFKLQSAFWKKKTSKNKTQTTSTKKDVRGKSVETNTNNLTYRNMNESATSKKENGTLIGNDNGKVESASVGLNHYELDTKVYNRTERSEAPTSSMKCEELEKIFQSTNNDTAKTRPEIFNSNTGNLVSTSSKQTTEIDIDLNDTKVKEVTRKIQNIFKRKRTPSKTGETPSKGESKKSLTRLKSAAATSIGSKLQTMPMISTSFLDRGEKERKETKASMVSDDCHGNTDDDERMMQSSNRYGGGELAKVNDEVSTDNKIGEPHGTFCDKTESQRIAENGSHPSVDDHDSQKNVSAASELFSPRIPCDDGGGVTDLNNAISATRACPVQPTLVEGAKGDKFTLNHDFRSSASVHYVDVNQLPILPSSSTASLLKNQDEVDIERLITTTMATTERNGHVNISNIPMPCSPTSLTTVPVSRRTRDREDDVDTSRLQSASTSYVNGKPFHGYLEQVSDDTEYETAYSDFSDRIDELERTLVQEEPILMKTATQHHSPRFLIRPNNASCFHGDHARFVCCMTGSPRPDISWFASGKVIRPERNNRLKITDYGEDNNDDACALVSILDIVEVKFEDKGEYACVAINSQGQAFSSAQLDVEERDSGPVQQSKSADVDG
nr:uncharacterized protein LOC129264114 [Lytechinus pictus]